MCVIIHWRDVRVCDHSPIILIALSYKYVNRVTNDIMEFKTHMNA